MKEITKEDVRRANMQAFVNEVVKDEDAKIGAEATAAAKALAKKQEEKKVLEDALIRTKEEATEALQTSQEAASAKLSAATEAVVQDVAKRAMILGQRQQLKRDQEIIKTLLEKQANASGDAARLAATRALAADMEAQAQEKVTGKLAGLSEASEQLVAEANEEALEAQQSMEETYEKARGDSREAVREASDHVNAVNKQIKILKDAAKRTVEAKANADQSVDETITSDADQPFDERIIAP